MNVALHALAGGALAHVAARLSNVRDRQPKVGVLVGSGLDGVASHGVLDWLRHGYPIPSALDVLLALALSATWLALVRPRLRLLFASALAGAFLPDVLDHLPALLDVPSPWPTPLFPWHTPEWSGSLYPAARIRPGSHLMTLETGSNQLVSVLNHVLVLAVSLFGVVLGRESMQRPGWWR